MTKAQDLHLLSLIWLPPSVPAPIILTQITITQCLACYHHHHHHPPADVLSPELLPSHPFFQNRSCPKYKFDHDIQLLKIFQWLPTVLRINKTLTRASRSFMTTHPHPQPPLLQPYLLLLSSRTLSPKFLNVQSLYSKYSPVLQLPSPAHL